MATSSTIFSPTADGSAMGTKPPPDAGAAPAKGSHHNIRGAGAPRSGGEPPPDAERGPLDQAPVHNAEQLRSSTDKADGIARLCQDGGTR